MHDLYELRTQLGIMPKTAGLRLTIPVGLVVSLLMAFTLVACIGGGGSPGVSNDAGKLSGLEIFDNTQVVAISPAFDPIVTNYSLAVGGSTAAIYVKATAADPKATIRINNTAAVSGQVFGPIPLSPGQNTVNIVVDVPGTVKAYLVTVFRGTNANLAALSISPGSLGETFDPNVPTYTATVGNGTSQVAVTATLADAAGSLQINGQTTSSGQSSAPINLVVGPNTVNVLVTPLSGSAKQYSITVTRSASPLADLSGLAVVNASNSQIVTYTPNFTAGTLNYAAQTVPFSVSAVQVTASVADPTSVLAIQPPGQAFQPATSGVAFGPISLPNVLPAQNVIAVRVTAQNGTVKTYSLSIPRSAASSNSNLQALTLSSGILSPAFSAGNLTYHASIISAVANVTIVGTAQDGVARVQINNATPTQGSSSLSVPIVPGVPVPVVVIAEDNSTKTYTVTFNRSANLSSLALSAGSIQPIFAGSTLSYSLAVPNTTTSTTVTANQETVGSTMAVTATPGPFSSPLLSSTPSAAIPLSVGVNTITVRVTTAVGSVQDYVVTVTRAASGNVNLAALSVSSGLMTPAFSPSIQAYTVNVANSVAGLTVSAAAQDVASTTVSLVGTPPGGAGQPSPLFLAPLGVGTTTVSIVVTHAAGNSQTYTLTITKNSADLSGLVVSTGTIDLALTPSFNSGTLAYTATAPPLTPQVLVTPTVAALGSTVTVNGGLPTTPVVLSGPATVISVVVTPVTGPPATTYTLVVNR